METSNIQHRTSNIQWFAFQPLIPGWRLEVGCSRDSQDALLRVLADRQVGPTGGVGSFDNLRDVLRLVSDTAALRGDAVKHFF